MRGRLQHNGQPGWYGNGTWPLDSRNTAYTNGTWGNPTDAATEHGAKCAIGWTTTIYSDGLDQNGNVTTPGAETWSRTFWATVTTLDTKGNPQTIKQGLDAADKKNGLGGSMRSRKNNGNTGLFLMPAQFGD